MVEERERRSGHLDVVQFNTDFFQDPLNINRALFNEFLFPTQIRMSLGDVQKGSHESVFVFKAVVLLALPSY